MYSHCLNCHHKLGTERSRKLGFGPECERQLGIVEVMQLDFEQLPERFRGLINGRDWL
jgi:hypothetical protein